MRAISRRTVLEALCRIGTGSLADVTAASGLTKECARQGLSYLRSMGLVEARHGSGVGSKRAAQWSVLPAGREQLLDSSWTGYERCVRTINEALALAKSKYRVYHAGHVARQRLMGLSQEQIENEFDVRAYKGKGEDEEAA